MLRLPKNIIFLYKNAFLEEETCKTAQKCAKLANLGGV